MKIIHLNTFLTGGAARAAIRLHEALLSQGIDSTFMTLYEYKTPAPQNWIKWESRHPNFKQKILNRIYNTRKQIEQICNQYAIIKAKQDCEYSSLPFSGIALWNNKVIQSADIVHIHWVSGMIDYPDFFRFAKKPIVWTLHDMQPFSGLYHYENDLQKNIELTGELNYKIEQLKAKAIKYCKQPLCLVAPSKWLQNKAQLSLVFKDRIVHHIPYSLNLEAFKPTNKSSARHQLCLPLESSIFLFVSQGLNIYRKGFDLLAASLKQVLKTQKILVIAIGESLPAELLEIPEIIKRGSIFNDELLSLYYSAADACLLPSREDNLPNVMLESMACGTPVIAFDTGGMSCHVIEGKTGLLVNRINTEDFANAIQIFLKSPEKYHQQTVRAYAEINFSPSVQAKAYWKIYDTILSSK
jgi:glycosyltransferase involved in cell wall biosynthesis